jgi:hypothetical protein
MAHLDVHGHYRGRGGADPRKNKAEREAELRRMAETGDGCDVILYLWKEIKGIPAGIAAPEGTLIRTHMIPELLANEYPSG